MPTLGLELCDTAFQAAVGSGGEVHPLTVRDDRGNTDWPGFAYFDGQKFAFGHAAEDEWFVHPRRIAHTFWDRLAHEPSTLGPVGKPAAFSELAFHFLREFYAHLALAERPDKVVIAAPGSYLKDPATEEEKIGLLLGMAGELKLPLAGVVDMACAALCDPRGHGFNPALPIVVLDLHLEGADVTLVTAGDRLVRQDFIHLPNSGYVHLLKHLTATMGNRFLRHTAFDILEDGRIEQMFFRQTKDFLLSGTAEHRFQINTKARTYEMLAKREQLANDAQAFITTFVQAVQNFLHSSPHASEPCTVALTQRTGQLPGLETRLRAAGFTRILRLGAGAAAAGAAAIGEGHFTSVADIADVPVETSLPGALGRRSTVTPWEARLQKLKGAAGTRPAPTHAILEGVGHPLSAAPRFVIGAGTLGADLVLPDAFSSADDCSIALVRESGRLFFVEDAPKAGTGSAAARTLVEAGDRLTIRCGGNTADVLFAHCRGANGTRAHD